MPDLRQDPISGRLVIIAEERAKRPFEFQHAPIRQRQTRCPFCEGNEQDTPAAIANYREDLPTAKPWQVRVVPNKYPAINGAAPNLSGDAVAADNVYQSALATGTHEVIIESPQHITSVTELTEPQAQLVYQAYRDRLLQIAEDEELAFGVVFKNSGARAGASLEHLHSQLMALSVLPPELQVQLRNCERFLHSRGECVYCWMIEHELEQRQRVVAESASFVAICPFASRFDYETWILPRQHSAQFEDSTDQQLRELSQIVRETVSRMEHALGHPAYNLLLHSGPFDRSAQAHYHWHIETFPRLTQIAGFELATNCYINCTPPEKAAAFLRQVRSIR